MKDYGVMINDYYQQYKTGKIMKRTLETLIIKLMLESKVLYYPRQWDEETIMDFLSWFYPRLKNMIDLYKDIGFSFKTYFYSRLQWSIKEYGGLESKRRVTEYTSLEVLSSDDTACKEPEEADRENDTELMDQVPNFRRDSQSRQLLILVLKSYSCVTERILHFVSEATGMKMDDLQGLLDEVGKNREHQDERVRLLTLHIHSQFHRCLIYEQKLKFAIEGSVLQIKLIDRDKRGRARLERMRKRRTAIRVVPSNKLIGEILGVPKGTIDSGLYAIKAKYRNIDDVLPIA
ncbi:hypothetical protein ACYULU_03835 [Breznakiellaceae bacterium SP9]